MGTRLRQAPSPATKAGNFIIAGVWRSTELEKFWKTELFDPKRKPCEPHDHGSVSSQTRQATPALTVLTTLLTTTPTTAKNTRLTTMPESVGRSLTSTGFQTRQKTLSCGISRAGYVKCAKYFPIHDTIPFSKTVPPTHACTRHVMSDSLWAVSTTGTN